MAHPSISIPDAMLETVDERVGVDRSGWIREAIGIRLFLEAKADAHDDLPEGWWQDAIEEFLNERYEASIEVE